MDFNLALAEEDVQDSMSHTECNAQHNLSSFDAEDCV